MTEVRRTIDAVWKLESARIIAGLTRMVHDVGLAEELAQDAVLAALEQWPEAGLPDNPGAWLMATAKRRAVDHFRRSERLERKQAELAHQIGSEAEPGEQPDDVLRLMFITCHPVLAPAARPALTLRLLGGLSPAEIARAFLTDELRISRRIAAAKRALAEEQVAFELPDPAQLAGRLTAVLEVIYLIFNEGYSATSGEDLIRPGLCLEALRLGRLLAELAPDQAEVHGLVALMEIQSSRSAARTGPSGEPVQLHEQNRGQWDPLLIRRGFTALLRARELGGPAGPYVLQAAIAVSHAQARMADDTDWEQIAGLYEALAKLWPTPIVQLNRAVAVGKARGAAAGLALTDALANDRALRDYHLLPAVRGDLLVTLGRPDEARREFERASALTRNAAEQAFLQRRAQALPVAGPTGAAGSTGAAGLSLGEAAEAFLQREGLDAETTRAYRQTLRRLRRDLGEQVPLADLTGPRLAEVFSTTWNGCAAATWNRHRSAVRSFGRWTGRPDLSAELPRRAGAGSRTPSLGPIRLADVWSRPGTALREQALWRLLHESGAGARAVLALNVEDLDLDARRADHGPASISWRPPTAELLAAVIGTRRHGPLFLADRWPGPARTPGPADVCPHTGRSRLSYERAEYLFKQATRSLDPAGTGYTLRQLKA